MFNLCRLLATVSAALQRPVHTAATFPLVFYPLVASRCMANLWSELGLTSKDIDTRLLPGDQFAYFLWNLLHALNINMWIIDIFMGMQT